MRESLKATKKETKKLESMNVEADTSFHHLHQELSHICQVCNEAWCNRYSEGLMRLKDHMLLDSGSDLRLLDLKSLEPDLAVLEEGARIGEGLILSLLSNDPIGLVANLGTLKAGSIEFEEDLNASLA